MNCTGVLNDSLGFVSAPSSSFFTFHLACPPSSPNTQHVPTSPAAHPIPGCRRPSSTRPWLFPDGMLNSYHLIIWVCPNHWLSPRLHLQSPTQLLSPTPTEVTWRTASHPSSVPPSFVCRVATFVSSACVRQSRVSRRRPECWSDDRTCAIIFFLVFSKCTYPMRFRRAESLISSLYLRLLARLQPVCLSGGWCLSSTRQLLVFLAASGRILTASRHSGLL